MGSIFDHKSLSFGMVIIAWRACYKRAGQLLILLSAIASWSSPSMAICFLNGACVDNAG